MNKTLSNILIVLVLLLSLSTVTYADERNIVPNKENLFLKADNDMKNISSKWISLDRADKEEEIRQIKEASDTWELWSEQTKVINDDMKVWTIRFNEDLDNTTINDENIYIEDSTGTKISGLSVSLGESSKIIKVEPIAPYEFDEEYYLYITKRVKSLEGKSLKNGIKFSFTLEKQFEEPEEPEADAGNDIVTYKSFKVALDGSKSKVAEGRSIRYNWRFISKPSGSSVELTNNTSQNPYFEPDKTGEYIVGLSVSDGINSSGEASVKIKVKSFGDTVDDIDTSVIGDGNSFSDEYDMSDMIALSDGWVIVKDTENKKIVFTNVLSGEIGKEIQLDCTPNRLEFDFERDLLFVSLNEINRIAQINVNNNEITYISINGPASEITYGENGILFAMSQQGDWDTEIQVVDTEQEKVVSSLTDSDFNFMAYDKQGNNLILGEQGTSPSSLARYSFNEITYILKKEQEEWDMGSNGQNLSISEDGKHVAFSCGGGNGTGYTIFDIDSSDITKRFGEWETGAYPQSTDFTLDSKYIVTSNGSEIKIFDVDNHCFIREINLINSYHRDAVYFSRGGKIIYNTSSNTLSYYQSMINQDSVTNPDPATIPVAVTQGDRITFKGFKVSFDGSNSKNGVGTALTYEWTIVEKPQGSQTNLINDNTPTPYYVPDLIGDYKISFVVNNGLSDSEELIINVKVKDIENTTDDISYSTIDDAPSDYIEGYVVKESVALSDGWLINADNTNKIKIFNAITGEIGKEYQVTAKPNSIDFDFDEQVIVASLENANKIVKIDILNDTMTYIETPHCYTGLTLGEDNIVFAITEAWSSGYISIIDIQNNEVLKSIPVSVYGSGLIEYDKTNRNLFVAERGSSPSTLFRYSFDATTNGLNKEQEQRLGSNGIDLALSNDGKHIAFSCGGGNGSGYTIFDIDSTDITKRFGEWNTGAYPTSADFTTDNKYILTSNGDELKIFDVENHYLVTTIDANESYSDYEKVLISRGGKILYKIVDDKIIFYKNTYTSQ